MILPSCSGAEDLAAAPVAISVRRLTKTYSETRSRVPALRGVDLDIRSGELVMLLGPSGSGKTTLLSIMGCILSPGSGELHIAGKEISNFGKEDLARVRLRHIGFVFQDFNLFSTLTAAENVEMMLALKGVRGRAAHAKARDLLDRFGVGGRHLSLPSDLSGGEKQRVAIARALAGDPDIVLADEPTAALDSHAGRTVIECLRGLAHDGKRAVVVVTHDSRVVEFADRIVRMEDGLIAHS